MTPPVLDLTDPGSAFLATDPGSAFLASRDPQRFLRDNLPSTDVDKPGDNHEHVKAAVAIAAAFLLWRVYASRQLRQQPPPVQAANVLAVFWNKHVPIWMRFTVPVIAEMYQRTVPLTQDELEAVAIDYARRLGEYVHATSADALIQGYHQELRHGTSPTLAWLRAVEGYGLDARRLRSWLRTVAQDKTVREGDLISPGGRRALDRALLLRADVLGDTEAWHARHVGRSILWMYQQRTGELPSDATKRWLTAHDERVCAICGPLHRHQEPLTQPFLLPDGRELWAPGVHPNCRCELELVLPQRGEIHLEKRAGALSKARGDDPYDRDQRGRFAQEESRRVTRPAPPVKERDLLPEVERLLAEPTPEEVPVGEGPDIFGEEYVRPDLLGDELDEGPDIFGEDQPAAESYYGPDIFGEEGPDIFAEEGPDIFSEDVLEPTHSRMIYLLPQEPPVEVKEPTPVGFEQVADRHGYEAVIPADYYFGAFVDRNQGTDSHPEAPINDIFTVGDPVDFDRAWRAYTAAAGWGVFGKEGISGSWLNDKNPISAVLGELSSLYDEAAFRMEGQQYTAHEVDAARADFRAHLTGDAYQVTDLIPTENIAEIYETLGEGNKVIEMTEEELREDFADRLGDENDKLNEAAFDYLLEHDPPPYYTEAMDTVESSLGEDYLRTPQIFTFPEGHIGGWNEEGTVPRFTGKYRVKAIIPHDLGDMHDSAGMSGGPTDRIKSWREVQLIPDPEFYPGDENELPHDRRDEVE